MLKAPKIIAKNQKKKWGLTNISSRDGIKFFFHYSENLLVEIVFMCIHTYVKNLGKYILYLEFLIEQVGMYVHKIRCHVAKTR